MEKEISIKKLLGGVLIVILLLAGYLVTRIKVVKIERTFLMEKKECEDIGGKIDFYTYSDFSKTDVECKIPEKVLWKKIY